MILVIDVGNTNCVLGLFTGGKLRDEFRLSTHPLSTADEVKMKIDFFIRSNHILWNEIQQIVVSSVVPEFTSLLKRAFPPQLLSIIDSTWPFSFEVQIECPEKLGTDLLVDAEAACREHHIPCIIVDIGTATTICALTTHSSNSKNHLAQHLGGAILPGLMISMHALSQKTAQLFTIEMSVPKKAIGKNTRTALESGIILGHASMIDGMVQRFKSELGNQNLSVIATGGLCNLMKKISTQITYFDPYLTLKGIYFIYETYRSRASC